MTHLVSTGKSFLRSPSIGFMTNALDSSPTSSYSSHFTSGSWTAGRSQEQQVKGFESQKISTIQDRIKSAMSDLEVSYQFWAPVTIAGRKFLTTSDQPYSCFEDIQRYREVCSDHLYSIDIGKEDQLGPPGRVFLQGWPEFSPNVWYYSPKEYHLRNYALECGVEEYCALPVFDSTGESLVCVGVLELLLTFEDVEDDGIGSTSRGVMEAIEAVGLISSGNDACGCRNIYSSLIATRAESQKVLDVLCEKYSFPMARAWALCACKYAEAQFGVHECHSHRTENSVCKVRRLCVDEDHEGWDDSEEIHSFRVNCSSLREGQGLVGKALASRKSCFCKDVTQFSLMDYPFAHYARNCQLTSCFAIFLCSIDPEFDICILELFPAPGRMYSGDPRAFLQSLLATIAPHLHNFKVSTGGQEEQGEKLIHEVHLISSDDNVDYFQISQSRGTLNEFEGSENERDQPKINSSEEVENTNAGHIGGEEREVSVTDSKKEGRIELEGKQVYVGAGITFELVQQQFGRKLEDAAESLGVSRSTFKRELRKLGIPRWPSHKRRKLSSVGEELIGDYPTRPTKSNSTFKRELRKIGIRRWPARKRRKLSSVGEELFGDYPIRPTKSNVAPEKGRSAADTAMQDKNTMIIKATYGDDIIKFPLSFSSGIEDLKHEIEKRLKLQSYVIKYKDEDSDWILMACNDDLRYSMQIQRELGKTSVQLLLIEN